MGNLPLDTLSTNIDYIEAAIVVTITLEEDMILRLDMVHPGQRERRGKGLHRQVILKWVF